MAKWKELPPSSEAIVKAALERAAAMVNCGCINRCEVYPQQCPIQSAHSIRHLASDPAEVAAIIKKAGQ